MVSLGGLDRTILVWNIHRPEVEKQIDDGEESDGLDDLDEDVDVNFKAIHKPPKKKKNEEFYEVEDEGD